MEASWTAWTASCSQPPRYTISTCSYENRTHTMTRRRLTILGSTGSIGRQALDVVRQFPDRFEVVGLSAGRDADTLAQQATEFHPEYVALESADTGALDSLD